MDNFIYLLEIVSNAALILKQLYVNEKHDIGGKSKHIQFCYFTDDNAKAIFL